MRPININVFNYIRIKISATWRHNISPFEQDCNLLSTYVGHFKSSAHCACAACRMMQSFWFSRHLWADFSKERCVRIEEPTWSLFCKTEPWNGRRNWLESDLALWPAIINQRAASCLRCSIGNFGKVWMASASPPAVQSWHEPTSLWLVPRVEGMTPWETLQKHWGV